MQGDRVQLQQVILNLLQNAMEAAVDHGERDRWVRLGVHRAGPSVQVVVSDSGPGLRAREDAVFEPFYTTKQGGMGMGLSIAKSIVEGHGGSIRARRDTTGGAVFDVLLPLDIGA